MEDKMTGTEEADLKWAFGRIAELENAGALDESIQPDGSLRPSVADTVARAEAAEQLAANNWELVQGLNKHAGELQQRAEGHIYELAELRQLAVGWMNKNNTGNTSEWQGLLNLLAFSQARLHQLDIAGRAILDDEK